MAGTESLRAGCKDCGSRQSSCTVASMRFLNPEALDRQSAETFCAQAPYPWAQLESTLTPDGYAWLHATLPDLSVFDRKVGVKRAHGQKPHDRGILHYRPYLHLPPPWTDFIAELHGEAYQNFLRRMLGPRRFLLTMEWYYAWSGCSVSPHCDARRKLATHIFYFSTEEDWQPAWGGDILILDDAGRFRAHSAPDFDDLRVAASLTPRGNRSLFFARTEHSWHGVRPLQCPPGVLRKLFIVTVNLPTLQVAWRRLRGKDPDGYPLRQHKMP
jgi:hypothetical protein